MTHGLRHARLCRGACHHDVTHLIAILADRIAVGMSETAACQVKSPCCSRVPVLKSMCAAHRAESTDGVYYVLGAAEMFQAGAECLYRTLKI